MIDGIDFISLSAEEYWSNTNKNVNTRDLAKSMIFSGDYIGARKVDGHHYRFIYEDDDVRLQGRKPGVGGECINRLEWVPHIKEALLKLPKGTVLVGEIYFPNNESSKAVTTVMGCNVDKAILRQQTDKLYYYIFDILAWNGKSLLKESLDTRLSYFKKYNLNSQYVQTATYYEGRELWEYMLWALAEGYEGVVIQKRTEGYGAGLRTAKKTLKIKKEIELEIDAFLTGNIKPPTMLYEGKSPESWNYWMHSRTGEFLEGEANYDIFIDSGIVTPVSKDFFYSLPGSVEFGVLDDKGQDVSLCWVRGITDELKWEIKESTTNCRGKIAKITAMEIDNESGKLRHSKIKEWRLPEEMDMSSCLLSKIPK